MEIVTERVLFWIDVWGKPQKSGLDFVENELSVLRMSQMHQDWLAEPFR